MFPNDVGRTDCAPGPDRNKVRVWPLWEKIPQEIRDRISFKGSLNTPGQNCLSLWFSNWSADDGTILLYEVLVDTSARHEGICLKPEYTYRPTILLAGQGYFLLAVPVVAGEV